MTTRPKSLPTAIAAAFAGIAHLPEALLATLQDSAEIGAGTTGGFNPVGRSRSHHTVAQDKRAARKTRNRAKARRRS